MKLLTVGVGSNTVDIIQMLAKRGVKVNRVPLFKSYIVLNSEEQLSKVSLSEDRKFYVHGVDVSGVISSILKIPEIVEGSLIITSLEDVNFGFPASIELCKKLRELTEEIVISLAIVPSFDRSRVDELKRNIRELKKHSDILILFDGVNRRKIVEAMNLLALAGEVDLKRRLAGEVVVDTSDIFNALKGDGFSVIGYAKTRIPFDLKRKILGRRIELKALRTKRMVDLTRKALKDLSLSGDLKTAKSALILFAAKPSELTMEGLFSSISEIEAINENLIVRYGDYPLMSRKMAVVILFSGIRKFKFRE